MQRLPLYIGWIISLVFIGSCGKSGKPTATSPSPGEEKGSREGALEVTHPGPAASAQPKGMVLLASGSFQMGSEDGFDYEKPVHTVTLRSFWMDITPVTNDAYRACVDAGKCTTTGTAEWSECNWGKKDRGNHPINCVNWGQATDYCTWIGKRLPTEEEWEYAARGPSGNTYPWGNAEPEKQLCWDGENNDLGGGNRKGTCAVGSFPEGDTPTGLKDMAGNVWEWTSSYYCKYASSGYDTKECEPTRVFRGGCWSFRAASMMRGSDRDGDMPSNRSIYTGFRCARDL